MYSNKSIKKWLAPVSLAGLLVTSQLPTSLVAHAAESTSTTTSTVKSVDYHAALKTSALWLYNNTPNAKFGNEDVVTDLARSGFPVAKNYYTNYYNNVVSKLKSGNGKLFSGEREVSAGIYGKVILAITAIGKDATNVDGHNLVETMLEKLLSDKDSNSYSATSNYNVLYALDSANYQLPTDQKFASVAREQLVSDLVKDQFTDKDSVGSYGKSWQWPGVDGTAMVATALSKYKQTDGVTPSVEKALTYLASQLDNNAGYMSTYAGGDSPESISQVILALTSLNIDPKADTRFIKNNNWAISNLLTSYDKTTGGFKISPKAKISNDLSTDQSNRALQAYDRYLKQDNSFYNMTDAKVENLAYDTKSPAKPSVNTIANNKTVITGKTESYATITVKNGPKVIGTAKANFNGAFSVKIKKQKEGTTLKIIATDLAKNNSTSLYVKVVDKIAPKAPSVKKVTKDATRITGTAEAKATVYIVKNKKVIKTGKVSSNGKYSLSIKKQKAGTILTVYVRDASKNKSASKTIIVKSK